MATTRSLIIQTGNKLAREIPVPPSGLSFGRQEPSDIVIPDSILSRQHLRIEQKNGVWVIEDLGSRNGTMLNGSRITTTALSLRQCL